MYTTIIICIWTVYQIEDCCEAAIIQIEFMDNLLWKPDYGYKPWSPYAMTRNRTVGRDFSLWSTRRSCTLKGFPASHERLRSFFVPMLMTKAHFLYYYFSMGNKIDSESSGVANKKLRSDCARKERRPHCLRKRPKSAARVVHCFLNYNQKNLLN